MAARGGTDGTAANTALANLCSAYWYPLYAFLRGRGSSPHDAEDMTQEFLYRFLERKSFDHVSPTGGKFRSYLLASLKNFVVSEWERARAQRRGGGRTAIPLDQSEAETRYSLERSDKVTPEVLFERQWASTVLERTFKALETEYANNGKTEEFEELKGFLPGGHGGASRAELAARRGVGLNAIDVAVHRVRRRFGALLRAQVEQTVSSPDEVDEEIRYLISVVGG